MLLTFVEYWSWSMVQNFFETMANQDQNKSLCKDELKLTLSLQPLPKKKKKEQAIEKLKLNSFPCIKNLSQNCAQTPKHIL